MSSLGTIRSPNDGVNNNLSPSLTGPLEGAVGFGGDTFLPTNAAQKTGPFLEFGEWLRWLREDEKKYSQPQAVQRARAMKLPEITQGKLSYIERGLNGNPEPELLRQLATLYETPYETILDRWVGTRYLNPASQSGTTKSPQGASPVTGPASNSPVARTSGGTPDASTRDFKRHATEYRQALIEIAHAATEAAYRFDGGRDVRPERVVVPKTNVRGGHRRTRP